jgi:hypothetical protein
MSTISLSSIKQAKIQIINNKIVITKKLTTSYNMHHLKTTVQVLLSPYLTCEKTNHKCC